MFSFHHRHRFQIVHFALTYSTLFNIILPTKYSHEVGRLLIFVRFFLRFSSLRCVVGYRRETLQGISLELDTFIKVVLKIRDEMT